MNRFRKRVLLSVFFMVMTSGAGVPQSVSAGLPTAHSPGLPKYLVYKHFLTWISSLDEQSRAQGVSDAYAFSQSFASHAALRKQDLDLLKAEAQSLSDELQAHDQKASRLIADYREKAKAAIQTRKALPPLPSELRDLQRIRTAIIVQHVVRVENGLESPQRAALETYLAREFVPHLRLRSVGGPMSGVFEQRMNLSR